MQNFNHRLISGIVALGSTLPTLAASHIATPAARLTIGIYNQSAASEQMVKGAMRKAQLVLQDVGVDFTWIDCTAQTCSKTLASRPDFLTLRIVAHAIRSGDALGITSFSDAGASASIFYDRALELQQCKVTIPEILGIGIAHEIVHILLPDEPHERTGLMRPRWNANAFRTAPIFVSKRTARLMRREADRRCVRDVATVTAGTRYGAP
jgi:hypothetical protein